MHTLANAVVFSAVAAASPKSRCIYDKKKMTAVRLQGKVSQLLRSPRWIARLRSDTTAVNPGLVVAQWAAIIYS